MFFLDTMEATKKVSISLVLPMSCLILKATDPACPLSIKDFAGEQFDSPYIEIIQVKTDFDNSNEG